MLGLLATTGLSATCCAQDVAQQREAQLKAAYVFNFIKFVDWDARATGRTLDVCFSGADEVREALALASSDKLVATRSIRVRSLAANASNDDCEVMYVDASHPPIGHMPGSALSVGDAPEFTKNGGIIRLYTESNRLRFVINVANARTAGLQISSNLLKLASQVEQ